MELFFEAYLSRLSELYKDVEGAITGLPQEALDWVPGPDMNSLAVLVVHTCGAQRYWLGDVVGRTPSARNREAEFRVQSLDAGVLLDKIRDTLADAQAVLEKLGLQNLPEIRVVPRNDRQVTVAWALSHVLAHTALHVGHIELTRQLWDASHKRTTSR